MTKRTKRLLFYSAAALFLISSYIIVLYAQGYKYSFSEGKFLRTGSIYLKANTDGQVFLDYKFLNSTSYFGNSFTISGVLPGQYKVKVEKTGYSTWQKEVAVEEGLVNEFSKILLLPQTDPERTQLRTEITGLLYPPLTPKPTGTPTPIKTPAPQPTPRPTPRSTVTPTPKPEEKFYIKSKILFDNTGDKPVQIAVNAAGFSLSEDERKIVWWADSYLWIMWLKDNDHQPYHQAGDKELLMQFKVVVKKAVWFDSDHIVADVSGYKVLEIDKRGSLNIIEI